MLPGHRSKVFNFKLNGDSNGDARVSLHFLIACLEFVVLNSAYHNNTLHVLKPKQVLCLESFIYLFNFARLNYTIDNIVQTSTRVTI